MGMYVQDCPRCGAKEITFDVRAQVSIGERHGWQKWLEIFCVCRRCGRPTVFVVAQKGAGSENFFDKSNGLVEIQASINHLVEYEGYVNLTHRIANSPPDYVPDEVSDCFREGATCLSVNCWNAACAMFRTAIDVATRPLLPEREIDGLNSRTRRDLGLRLPWLFQNGLIPRDLEELSTCIREDGNDGVHRANLDEVDALDILDFTTALLERMYTEPARLKLAAERRQKRREVK